MKKCVIISGGNIKAEDLLNYLAYQGHDIYIIGVDGGCKVLYEQGIIPNQILGDFDTLDSNIVDYYMQQDIPINRLDPIKDLTDTHAAFEAAKEIKAKSIDVFGFFGTRLDHSIGSLMTGFKYANGVKIRFFDEHNIVYIINEEQRLTLEKKSLQLQKTFQYVSIIPIERTHIVQTESLKYPLKSAWLSPFDSYGVSNEIDGALGLIEVKEGKCLVIQSNDS